MLIKGAQLTSVQRRQVLAAFVHRWTIENRTYWDRYSRHAKPTVPMSTDAEWLAEHGFHFVKDGSRLSLNHRYAEPVYMADLTRG